MSGKPSRLRNVINLTIGATKAVGAPCTWVLANHDTPRVVTRYGKAVTGVAFGPDGMDPDAFLLPGQFFRQPTDVELGRRRARAAALLELALPGGAYVYQGDELGLEEVEDLPDELLQDPTWLRSGQTERGRDGCRVPIPWSGSSHPLASDAPSIRLGCRSRRTGRRSRWRRRTATRTARSPSIGPR